MKKTAILAALALGTTVWSVSAQDQGGQRPERPGGPSPEGQGQSGQRPQGGPGQGGQGGQGREGFRPPAHPVVTALDANSDGVIDESEMKNATAALKKLDKNGDGKLSDEELRPAGMGRGGFGGQAGGQGGGRTQGGQGSPGGQGGDGVDFTARLLQNDKNADGKLSKDELPERMQGMFSRLDTNNDGFIDKTEMQAMAQQMRDRGPQSGGDGQRPAGQSGDGKTRPQRPASE